MNLRTVSARLSALEGKVPERRSNRVIRLVCNDGEEAAAVAMAKAEGYDESSGDICVIRLIVSTAGDKRSPMAPHIIGKTGDWKVAS